MPVGEICVRDVAPTNLTCHWIWSSEATSIGLKLKNVDNCKLCGGRGPLSDPSGVNDEALRRRSDKRERITGD
jgi:hypothetical protein